MELYPRPGQRRLATITLSLTVLFASSLPYLFVGPLPIWIVGGLICAGIAVQNRRFLANVTAMAEIRWAIGSWILLILFTLMLDVLGYADREILPGPILSLLTLLTFMGTLAVATFANRTILIGMLLTVAVLQGAVSALQFAGFTWAWEFGSAVTSNLPLLSRESDEIYDTSLNEFAEVGRVRGTHLLVHIYNSIQSVLVSFLVFMVYHSANASTMSRLAKVCRQFAILVAAVGLLLSFSRSGLIALIAAGLLALSIKPTITRLTGALLLLLTLLGVLNFFEFMDAAQFARIINIDSEAYADRSRLDHLAYALRNFIESPVIGASGVQITETLELPIHSVPLRYLNDYGAIGFVLYFSVLVPFLTIFVRGLRSRSPELAAWAGGGLTVLIAIAADSWTHSSGFLRRDIFHAMILAIIVGSIIAIRRNAGSSLRKNRRPPHSAGFYKGA